jgi:aromatic-L-amino-acid/L-tryptophan decarboxylase
LSKSRRATATKRSKSKTTTRTSGKPSDPLNRRSSPVELAPEKFRAIGRTLVDSIADFLERLPKGRTASPLLPNEMRSKLGKREMPEKGTDIAPIVEKFSRLFFEHSTHNGSPRFFGYITSSAAPISALADLLVSSQPERRSVGALSHRF